MNERELLRARAGVHLTFLNRGSTRKKLDRPKARMPRARRRVGGSALARDREPRPRRVYRKKTPGGAGTHKEHTGHTDHVRCECVCECVSV